MDPRKRKGFARQAERRGMLRLLERRAQRRGIQRIAEGALQTAGRQAEAGREEIGLYLESFAFPIYIGVYITPKLLYGPRTGPEIKIRNNGKRKSSGSSPRHEKIRLQIQNFDVAKEDSMNT